MWGEGQRTASQTLRPQAVVGQPQQTKIQLLLMQIFIPKQNSGILIWQAHQTLHCKTGLSGCFHSVWSAEEYSTWHPCHGGWENISALNIFKWLCSEIDKSVVGGMEATIDQKASCYNWLHIINLTHKLLHYNFISSPLFTASHT